MAKRKKVEESTTKSLTGGLPAEAVQSESPAADYVIDAEGIPALLAQFHRTANAFQSVLFAGEGCKDLSMLEFACAQALDAVRPGGVLYVPERLAKIYPISRLNPTSVDGHPGYLQVKKKI